MTTGPDSTSSPTSDADPDEIAELVDWQLAKQPRLTFNCHKCGPVGLDTRCGDPYPFCPFWAAKNVAGPTSA